MELNPILVWIAGALFMLTGSWVMGNLELTVGVTQASYLVAVLASFVLFLLAGLCWIAVAFAVRK